MPTFVSPFSISKASPVDTHETLMVIVMIFIRHHIDTRIHDIMYHVSQQLAYIGKLIFHNKVQQANKLEVGLANSGDNSMILSPHKEFNETKVGRHF